MKNFTQFGKFLLFLFFFFSILLLTPAKATDFYFYVQFADKNNSPYRLENPQEFLSERAIERRNFFSLSVDSTDLPVNPSYLSQVMNLGGEIHSQSRWLNGATVVMQDSALIEQVVSLPFVKWVQYTGKKSTVSNVPKQPSKFSPAIDYGLSGSQIAQVKGNFLHELGYFGKNIVVGVLDAGFLNVDINVAFDSLRLHNRLLGTKDFVGGSDLYRGNFHGGNVLSIMAGNLPQNYLGTAPDASYWLIRTEDVDTEYLKELDFWVAGIEFADSVGSDVVNSSLGYFTFDDSAMNFTYADMNGEVSRAAKAASMAAQKGMIVVCSAGNEGDKTWKYISTPADAKGIITVGGVTADGTPSVFSSFGPSADGRVKPEICARGTQTSLINSSGNIVAGNGTSYSSPLICGLMACYLQYFKEQHKLISIPQLLQSVFVTGSLYGSPTDQMGYGIPDFQLAFLSTAFNGLNNQTQNQPQWLVDEKNKTIQVNFAGKTDNSAINVQIHAMDGKLLLSRFYRSSSIVLSIENLSSGIYLVSVENGGKIFSKKILVP